MAKAWSYRMGRMGQDDGDDLTEESQ